jgi:hypothetical protein
VTTSTATVPKFPGGMAAAPEAVAGGCANAACSCLVDAGRAYCCAACRRAREDAPQCQCQHFGCTARVF